MTTEFIGKIRSLSLEYNMLPPGSSVLCAVSGGLDSMVLLHVLGQLTQELGFSLKAAHFNHKLRGEEAQADAAFVANYCKEQGIPITLGEEDVAAKAQELGLGIEECARNLRYAFLEDAARQTESVRIVTGHHADDNVETMLFRLVRGTGLRGLGGIPPVRDQIVRPMLLCSREEIEDYAREQGIPFVEDVSNQDTLYRRNYLRHAVIPLLREMNPKLTQTLSGTIRSLREDQDYLTARAMEVVREAKRAEEGLVIPRQRVAMQPRAVAVRVIQMLLEGIEAPAPESGHIESILDIARSQEPTGSVSLPGGVLVQRVYGDLLFAYSWEQEPLPPMDSIPVLIPGTTQALDAGWAIHVWRCPCPETPEEGVFYLAEELLQGELHLRPRQTGDQLALPFRRSKSLKKVLIEEKVPRRIRERLPVLADELGLLAVAGFGPDRSRLAKPGQKALAVRFEQLIQEEKGS